MRRLTAALAVAVIALSGCAASDDDPTPGGEQGYVAGDGSIVLLPGEDRVAAPDLTGQLLSGGTLSTADFRGAVVVLNVWASWCAPCRAEAPDLQEVWDATRDGGVQFIGLDTRDSQAAAEGFVRTYGLTYPQLLDPDGRLQLEFRDTLPPQSIPSTVVLDREGRVAARILGAATQSQLLGVIEPLVLEESATPAPETLVVP